MSVAKEYEDLLHQSWIESEEQINQVIYQNRKVKTDDTPRYHSQANHDFHMEKYHRCVYCQNGYLIGERPKEEENKE